MRVPRRLLAVVLLTLVVVGSGVLTGCKTLQFADDPLLGSAQGWVVFSPYDFEDLTIHRIVGGMEAASLRINAGMMAPLAHACPPGRNEFIARHQKYEERLTVPVTEGAITYVGFWRQVTKEETRSGTTTKWYNVRSSVGTHPLPADPKAADPAPYIAALADTDWATRREALRGLERIGPELDTAALARLMTMAREDSTWTVLVKAQELLKKLGYPAPAPPPVWWSFRHNVDLLPAEDTDTFAAVYAPEGYALEGRTEKSFWWRTRSIMFTGRQVQGGLSDSTDLGIIMECSWQEGAELSAYGLTIGSDADNCNAFCANHAGGAVVLSVTGGALTDGPAPLPWTNEAATAIAGSPVTRFEVAKRGADYTLTINGKRAGSFTDTRSLPVSRIGVFLAGRQQVVFHKIVVTGP